MGGNEEGEVLVGLGWGSVFCPPYQVNLGSEQTWIKKMIHFRFKFPKIGAQSGIELSPMGDRGCGGLLGGNANIINTPPHIRGPMGEHIRNSGRNASR